MLPSCMKGHGAWVTVCTLVILTIQNTFLSNLKLGSSAAQDSRNENMFSNIQDESTSNTTVMAPQDSAVTSLKRARRVGKTSNLMAHWRAVESTKENPLIVDPYAARLAGSEFLDRDVKKDGFKIDFMAVRTKIFDSFLEDMVQNEGIEQLVIIGAGQDSRAFRLKGLAKEGVRVFELDFPHVLEDKRALLLDDPEDPMSLPPTVCERIEVPVDLAADDWDSRLVHQGYDPSQRSAWIIEGVTGYISEDANKELFQRILDRSPTGSHVLATFIGVDSRMARGVHKFQTDTPAGFLRGLGFDAEMSDISKYAKKLGRGRGNLRRYLGYLVVSASKPAVLWQLNKKNRP
mmetsp:Transcript_3115/g.5968  ORF Transcript_3115/g.5968 Transcript_3115/m.5968 type:complete len:347 (-) Transcript_3115:265-1305(-)